MPAAAAPAGSAAAVAAPRSIRTRLLALSLLPLLGVLPLLGLILLIWGNDALDRLLIGKVRSDLAVASGYFERVQAEIGGGTQAVAASHLLHRALAERDDAALARLLGQARRQQGLDFLTLLDAERRPRASEAGAAPADAAPLPRLVPDEAGATAAVVRLAPAQLALLAPDLLQRARIPLRPTVGAAPEPAPGPAIEERALLLLTRSRIDDDQGRLIGWLQGGVLLNRNLAFIDRINEIVYPEGSLPLGSRGTATLFLDDVRISTNVRLFGSADAERAIGTRVSASVHAAVLTRGETWLDRAFVVNDWYVSGYLPLHDSAGARVGMLYVGFLERPLRQLKYTVLAGIGVVFVGVMLLAAWWSLGAAARIFRPLERMAETMHQVEQGDRSARVGRLREADDEIGRLGATLDHLLDVVDDKTRTLQRWGEELDLKVAERTRDLATAQQQLLRSEKLAAIGQLTASIAHEVNNPIAVIQGNLDLMRELLGEHARPVCDELQLIDQQVERMRLIVTQLLQFARPSEYAGYVETLQVREVIEASLVLVRHLLERHRVRLDWQCEAGHGVAINRQELQQVLINLIVNAVQAMQAAEAAAPALLLRTRDARAADGRALVLIEVADCGPGLDEAALPRLFQPFYTTKREGNGLGLWISRSLLERYGAELRAANRPAEEGPGALFTIELAAQLD
ncbi:MAG: hypothetical protein RJA44_369 [Pseudomonadota bacterium]|jgi:signal transduction histidine kinase